MSSTSFIALIVAFAALVGVARANPEPGCGALIDDSTILTDNNASAIAPEGRGSNTKGVDDGGFTSMRFANNVHLVVKPTAFESNRIYISVVFGAGLLGLPQDHTSPAFALSSFVANGTNGMALGDMEKCLEGHVWGVQFQVNEGDFRLVGVTTRQDLLIELKLLASYFNAPNWAEDGKDRFRSAGFKIRRQAEGTAQGVMGLYLASLLRGGDLRFALASDADISGFELRDIKEILEPSLTLSQLKIVVVGDADTASVVGAVGRTFGAMKMRPKLEKPAPVAKFAAGLPRAVVLRHKGRGDEAASAVAWPTVGFFSDPHKARVLRLLAAIVQNRLLESVRFERGLTYSPAAVADASEASAGFGYLLIVASDLKPDTVQSFRDAAINIISDMRSQLVTEDELDRARNVIVASLRIDAQSDGSWLSWLANADQFNSVDPLEAAKDYKSITAEDVRREVISYLRADQALSVSVLPDEAMLEKHSD